MNTSSLVKAALLTLVLVIAAVASWEFYVRHHDFDTSYDDGPALWAHKRKMLYEDPAKSTVFIGSSRNKFDVDIDTWENITGDHVIQLACVGSTPLPVLENLANDKNFKGKLIIDVTEGLFFSSSPQNSYRPVDAIKYYKEETPAQCVSFHLDHLLESQFAFLDKERLSLNAMLDNIKIPNRPGVFQPPVFANGFGRTKFNRQEYMTPTFLADTNQQNQQRAIWALFGRLSTEPPVSGTKLDSVLNSIKINTDKIKARGGQVIFVRTPSSGPYFMGESMGFPREKYWERILSITGCPGIHFTDYPVIAHFQCPEFSHLNSSDAIVYTKNLIKILTEEKGWKFPKK
ncbi:MAG: hypothetical protein ABIR78_07405 [Ferruginibacter sp.]